MSSINIVERWPEQLRLKRGMLNGQRVQIAYESRGIRRFELARKLGMPAKELAKREQGWHEWTEQEQGLLVACTEYPIAFFVQKDMPAFGPMFMCMHDEDGDPHCHVESGDEA